MGGFRNSTIFDNTVLNILLQHVDCMSRRHDARVTWVITETWVVYCPKSGANMTMNSPSVIPNDYKHSEQ